MNTDKKRVVAAHWIKAFQCRPFEQRENRAYRRDE